MRAAQFVFLIGVTAGSIVYAESTPREALLAISKSDHTLAIVDPSNLKVVDAFQSATILTK
jgi:hypothetical protein